MLRARVAALACLCLARLSFGEIYSSRPHLPSHSNKDLSRVLASIEERLWLLESINTAQTKQARRLDAIQDKLDRVETTLMLRIEKSQFAAERLEHRLHMLQNSIEKSMKENALRLDRSQSKIIEITQNLTNHLDSHRHLLEKVSGAYAETWRRGLVLESLTRDGMSLINATRRELADGFRGLARRQRDPRFLNNDMDVAFARRFNDSTAMFFVKMQEVLDTQKRFLDSCQRVQLDDPSHVADMLDKLIDSLINKTASTFRELQDIQSALRSHDSKVSKILSATRSNQNEATCKRLEWAIRNVTQNSAKDNELQQMTEKFIALTDRADAALQRLEAHLPEEGPAATDTDVTKAADQLYFKLKRIKSEQDSEEDEDWDDEEQDGYFEDSNTVGADIMDEDREILSGSKHAETVHLPQLRHLHKHPYDRGP